MCELFAVSVTEQIDYDLFERMLSHLSLHKQQRIRRYFDRTDAQRVLVAELLVRTIACRSLSLRNAELVFESNEWGKPRLINRKHFHYNISHAKDWVVCAVDTKPIGVDVEHIVPVDFSIANRFFSPYEAKYLEKMPKEEQLGCFFDLWTLKESYVKALGKGLSIPLDTFSLKITEQGDISLQTELVHDRCYFRQYHMHPEYKLSLCMYRNDFPSEVQVLYLHELFKQFLTFL